MSKRQHRGRRTWLSLSPLEGRLTPAAAAAPYALGVAEGRAGEATVYQADGTTLFSVAPYGADFTGGVRVAFADVTGDGTNDLITAPGSGTAPVIDVYDGVTKGKVASFAAYESTFTGGVNVAAADLTGDGKAEVIAGADLGGGPRVRVFDGATVGGTADPTALDDFLAIDDANFRGGVRLAVGDLNGDGTADLAVGAGYGGGPRVAVFDGASLGQGKQVKLVNDFYAFEKTLRNGLTLGVGDVDGDGKGDLICGGGPGGGPRVRVTSGAGLLRHGGGNSLDDIPDAELGNFFAGNPSSRDGVRVGTRTGADGSTEVVGLDVASGKAGLFTAGGKGLGFLTGGDDGKAGFFAGLPFGHGKGKGHGPGVPPPFRGEDRPGNDGPGHDAGDDNGGDNTGAVATHFFLASPPTAFAGAPSKVTVVALDASNKPVRDYAGTVTLTGTDTGATLPAAYTFTAADRGVHTFEFTPSAVGTQTLTAGDGGTVSGKVDVNVTTAPVAAKLAVETRRSAAPGETVRVVVVALDASNRPVPAYTGTVAVTSTDAAAKLPEAYTFTAADRGVHVFEVTLTTAGTQTVTATDTATASVLGSADLNVSATGGLDDRRPDRR